VRSVRCIVCILVVISTQFLCGQELMQQKTGVRNLPFDANKVITQVSNQYIYNKNRDDEFLIDTNVAYVPALESQNSVSIAFDGTNYLIVWLDTRNREQIYGARVSSSGVVLDTVGIIVSHFASWSSYPMITFGGTNYFVVWADLRNRYTSIEDIYGVRITQNGTILDTIPIAISTAAGSQILPAVAYDGANYLAVWEDNRSGSWEIYGARVNQSGNVIDSTGIRISTLGSFYQNPRVAFDGTNYLVVWEHGPIYGARVTTSGVVLDTIPITITSGNASPSDPSLAFDGNNFMIIWADTRGSIRSDIYGARVTPTGIVLDTSGIAISTAPAEQLYPTVSFGGSNYFVVWEDWRDGVDIYGARVTTSGIVLDSIGIPIYPQIRSDAKPAVSFDGINYFVVWQNPSFSSSGSSFDIYGARVNQAGSVLDSISIDISYAAYAQYIPKTAFDGTNYLVVFQDYRSGTSWDVYGVRVSQTGVILDPNGIVISASPKNVECLSLSFDGTNYLTVWCEASHWGDGDIYGARVTTSGVVLDTIPIAISTASRHQTESAVAFDGTDYFVVWLDWRDFENDIYGARVTTSGIVLDTLGINISASESLQTEPSIVFDGTNHLVIWQDNRNGLTDIYGTRVTQTGVVLDTSGIAISTAVDHQKFPAVAFDGNNYFVVWQDSRNTVIGSHIYGARVNQSGTVIDTLGILISDQQDYQNHPSIVFGNDYYCAVWQEAAIFKWYDIEGAKIDTAGTVTERFTVSDQPGNQVTPAITHGIGDQFLITYSGWTDSINNRPTNTMRIWGKFYPFIGVEEDHELSNQKVVSGLRVYPNPIHKTCNVKYSLPQKTKINLSLYDITGRLIKKFIDEAQDAGVYQKTFELIDLAQGIYFIRLNTEDTSEVQKVILIK